MSGTATTRRAVSSNKKKETVTAPVVVKEDKKKGRSKAPGVRVVGGRIYDSQNGKTCHQCRQKTMDFAAQCTNQKGDKTCPVKFCHKCLMNRYGEKAEEVSVLDDWSCPKCRGICNCSFCMKKKGHQPTGILVHTAKENGFSSVSQLLQVRGPENINKAAKAVVVSPVKPISSKGIVASSMKPRKESSDENIDLQPQVKTLTAISKEKKSRKTKRNGLVDVSNVWCNNDAISTEGGQKKPKSAMEVNEKAETNLPDKKKMKRDNLGINMKTTVESCTIGKCVAVPNAKHVQAITQLPPGTYLKSVAGLDLAPEDVGYALQFLEFCSSFDKVLNIKKGQPEVVLGEIINGRRGRRSQYSCVAQFHIHLLCMIHEDLGEESPVLTPKDGPNSWLEALGERIFDCQFISKELPSHCFDRSNDAYHALDVSKKLKLLNFLCDETLNTKELRSWMDQQLSKSVESQKEAKEKVLAAKEKEKQLKNKVQDEIAKALIAKNGAPLSIPEHEAIVMQIKTKAAQAYAELLEAMGMLPKKRQRSDAIRTEPVLLDVNGNAFWRLKGYDGQKSILLQEIENSNLDEPKEKWLVYDSEQIGQVEKYVTTWRNKRIKLGKTETY